MNINKQILRSVGCLEQVTEQLKSDTSQKALRHVEVIFGKGFNAFLMGGKDSLFL